MQKLNQWRNRKKELGLTNKQIAEKANLPLRTVEQVMCGTVKSPRLDTVSAIESALGITSVKTRVDDILEQVELNDIYPTFILGEVAAGVPLEEQENIDGVVYINYRPHEEYFALRVHGDSMKGIGILDKDVLIVHKQNCVENGEICVAMVNGQQTVKRFKQYGESIFLMPENPDFDPIPVTQTDSLVILGKVVEWRHFV